MKKLFLIIFPAIITFSCYAQIETGPFPLRSLTKLDLGPGGIGISREQKMGTHITMLVAAGAGGGYDIAEMNFNYVWTVFRPAFHFSVSPRLYYNRDKRTKNEKPTLFNSGNYVGLAIRYATGSVDPTPLQRPSMMLNGHLGLQRYLGKRWVLDTHFGGGYAWDIGNRFGTIYPALDINFSYVLNK